MDQEDQMFQAQVQIPPQLLFMGAFIISDLQGRVEGLEQENIELKKKNLELEQKIQELERKNEALSNELGAKNQEMALQIVMKCKSLCWKAFIH